METQPQTCYVHMEVRDLLAFHVKALSSAAGEEGAGTKAMGSSLHHRGEPGDLR